NNNPWPKPHSQQGTSINNILNNMSAASVIKNKLNNLNLYYIKQLLNHDMTQPRTWQALPHTIKRIPRGRQPKWYNELIIETNLWLEHNNTRLTQPNPFITHNETPRKKKWIIYKNKIIGKNKTKIEKMLDKNKTTSRNKYYTSRLQKQAKKQLRRPNIQIHQANKQQKDNNTNTNNQTTKNKPKQYRQSTFRYGNKTYNIEHSQANE
ncbi:4491_t:CDS:2, partial [Ambispora leptoticha]